MYDRDQRLRIRAGIERGHANRFFDVLLTDEVVGNRPRECRNARLIAVAEGVVGRPGAGEVGRRHDMRAGEALQDRKSTRLNSSHVASSYAVFCLNKKNQVKKKKDITTS